MLIVICGIIVGFLILSWIVRYDPSPFTFYSIAIFILAVVIAAVVGVIYDSYATSVEAVPAPSRWFLLSKEIVESFLVPFIAGAGIGAYFFKLDASLNYSKAPIIAASALGFALIVVLFAATERQYGWFSRIQKFSLASAELDFSPTKQTSITPAAIRSNDPNAAVGPSAVDKALRFIPNIAQSIVMDRDYLNKGTNHRPDFDERTDPDFEFMAQIVVPLVRRLTLIHDRRADNDISDYFDRQTVMAVRSLANLDGPRFDDVIQVEAGVERAWREACKETEWSLHVAGKENFKKVLGEPDPDCQDGKIAAAVVDKIRSSFGAWGLGPDQPIPLSPDRPYGAILSAWLLAADGEAEAALYDLDSLRRAYLAAQKDASTPDKKTEYEIYNFEILNTIDRLYVDKGTNPEIELKSLFYFKKTIESGLALIQDSGEQLAKMKETSRNPEIGIKAQCANSAPDWFKPVYLRYLIAINDFIDVAGKYPEMIVSLEGEKMIRDYADELASIDMRCLWTRGDYQKDFKERYKKTIPDEIMNSVAPKAIDEESTDDPLEAFYDSRATAYRGLAAALGTSDLTVWEKATCASLLSANDGVKLTKPPLNFKSLMDDLASKEIPEQGGDIEGLEEVVNLSELAKDDKNLLVQAGQDRLCSLYARDKPD